MRCPFTLTQKARCGMHEGHEGPHVLCQPEVSVPQPNIQKLKEAFDDFLITEAKRHGGIPALPYYELPFREAVATFLAREGNPSAVSPAPETDTDHSADLTCPHTKREHYILCHTCKRLHHYIIQP